jgi:hypothetical protein
MALLSQASDLQTRQTVWIPTDVAKGREQANSHTRTNFSVDGLIAADWAGMSAHQHRADVTPCPITGWRSKNWG